MSHANASAADASRLHKWIARASFPQERIDCKAFAFCEAQDEVVLKSRRDHWHDLFADASVKRKILERRGLSEAQWNESLRDVEVVAPEHLPDWAQVIAELYQCWQQHGEPIEARHLDDKPWLQLTAGWAQMCRPWLKAQQDELAANRIRLDKASADDLLEYLMLRLGSPVFNVLASSIAPFPDHEAARASADESYLTLDFWQNAFDRQPILVKIIGNLTLRWRCATQEMLQRFAADLPRLVESGLLRHMEHADDEVIVSRLLCGLGDPHRGGRSVAIFETSIGDVVYKPKDLIGTWASGELLRDLHRAHGEFVPLPPDFLYCDGYGWEQRVRHRECDRIDQVDTFYRRLGGWLFLVQLLNGNDFWYDNLIACADMPYFIDYETIVGNRLSGSRVWHGPKRSEQMEQLFTMQMIGILPLLMPGAIDGTLADGIDIGTSAPPGRQRNPFGRFKHGSALAYNNPYLEIDARSHAAFWRGEHQDMNDYMERFIDGYRRMAALLDSQVGRDALQRFLKRIARARFRQIVIDTWQCYWLLHRFFLGCSHDGVRATIALDRFLALFNNYSSTVAEGIRDDLWNNDVPLFELQVNSTDIFNAAGTDSEPAYFTQTAFDLIERNQAYLRDEIDLQIEHIGVLFATRPDRPRRNWRNPARKRAPMQTTREGLLESAQTIGDQLAQLICRLEDVRELIVLGRFQLSRDIAVLPLPLGVYGCSGIIVFLATLQRYVGAHEKHAQALQRCYEYLIADSQDANVDAFIAKHYAQQAAPNCGALSVTGAKLAALCRLTQIESATGNHPAVAIDDLLRRALHQMGEAETLFADFRHGVGGLLYRFAELESIFADSDLAGWIEQMLTWVERKPLQISPMQTDAYREYADALLPDAAAGMRLVDQYMQARWPTFVQHRGWLKLQRVIADAPSQRRDDEATGDLADDLMDERTEILMDYAYRFLAERGAAERAALDRVLDEIMQRRRDSGRWFPDHWSDDKFMLGAVHGQADMGLLLLSAHARENLNPFRL